MYSVLKKVDLYAQNFGMPYRELVVSSSYFPEYFNKIACEHLNRAIDCDRKIGKIDEYTISYEGNDKIKLIAFAPNGKTRLVIFPDEESFDYSIVGRKVSEEAIIKEAIFREAEEVMQINRILEMKGLKERYQVQGKPFATSLKESADKCRRYIEYWNGIYKEQMGDNAELSMGKLYYSQPVASTVVRRTSVNADTGKSERINSVLPVDERKQVLESYGPILGTCAYSKNSHDIEYFNYLYSVGDNRYLAIMEPYSGMSLTKAVYFKSNDGVDEAQFNCIVKSVLELPYDKVTKDKGIIGLYHSTMDSFDNKLSVLVTGKTKSDVNTSGLTKRVREAQTAGFGVK